MKTAQNYIDVNSGVYKYRMFDSKCSSERLGNCEVCGKYVSNMFHQIETRKFSEGYTHYKCSDYFGHMECLEKKRRRK